MKITLALVVLTIFGDAAQADVMPDAFNCMPIAQFAEYQDEGRGIRINNFSINERRGLISKMFVVEASFSVTNRNDVPVNVSGSIIGIDNKNGKFMFAMSVSPLMERVKERATETANGSTYANVGSLAAIDTICVNFTASTQ